MSVMEPAAAIDHRHVTWANVRRTSCLIQQYYRYDYPGPIRELKHRLIIVPPPRHGGQRLVSHNLDVTPPTGNVRHERDPFGNQILVIGVDWLACEIDFTARIAVEREAGDRPIRVSAAAYQGPVFREPTRLTMPDDALRAAAANFMIAAGDALTLGKRINAWVHQVMNYADGATGVRSSAAETFAIRRGVCQDFAHVMLVLCRLCGLPARYVSGHLLGEGGTHAWVEVLLPDPAAPGNYIARPFDPTHGTEPGLSYMTVAVGRDYADVAPTSGTFLAPYAGRLSGHKRADLMAIEYFSS